MREYVYFTVGVSFGLVVAILLVLLDGRFHNKSMFTDPYHLEQEQ